MVTYSIIQVNRRDPKKEIHEVSTLKGSEKQVLIFVHFIYKDGLI